MYRKISDENAVLSERRKPPTLVPLEQQKSYWACPQCQGTNLVNCGCPFPNYLCQNCEWTYYTHPHKPPGGESVYEKPTPKLLHTYTLPN